VKLCKKTEGGFMEIKELGQLIRKARKRKNLTQVKLAKKIHRSPQLLCDIEAGRRTPSLKTLSALAKALNLSIDNILKKE
jgi:transcriptional regulator with XRE-family HTH domain